jgi:hypothetical protein
MPTPPKKIDLSRDLDHDGDVDLADDRSRDLDHDGVIDSADEEEADIDRDHDIDATDRSLAAKKSVGEVLGMPKAGQGSQSQAKQQSTAPKIK